MSGKEKQWKRLFLVNDMECFALSYLTFMFLQLSKLQMWPTIT